MARTLLEVLKENNIALKDSSGGRKVTSCPFHQGDSTPSFTIYPNETYFCFGCQAWGDALKFLVDYKGWTTNQAKDYLGEDYHIPRDEKALVIKVTNTSDTWKFLYEVAMAYYECMMIIPGAQNYLINRGLTLETIKKYKLGYTDGHALNLKFAHDYGLAKKVGLITSIGFESLSHRITIPNLIGDKECDFIVGRTVTNDNIKYLGIRVPKPVYGFYEVRNSPILFLVEGQFDWLTLRQWGYPAVTLGGNNLTKWELPIFDEKKIVIIPDNDDVGIKAANSLKERFGSRALVLDYKLFGCKDISAIAEEFGDDGERDFKEVIKNQVDWIKELSLSQRSTWFSMLEKDD